MKCSLSPTSSPKFSSLLSDNFTVTTNPVYHRQFTSLKLCHGAGLNFLLHTKRSRTKEWLVLFVVIFFSNVVFFGRTNKHKRVLPIRLCIFSDIDFHVVFFVYVSSVSDSRNCCIALQMSLFSFVLLMRFEKPSGVVVANLFQLGLCNGVNAFGAPIPGTPFTASCETVVRDSQLPI